MSSTDTDTENELAALRRRLAEVERSEARYKSIFENSPVSIWEEDWSGAKSRVDELVAAGVKDLEAYFKAHPEDVLDCVRKVKVIDVNRATLELCRAESKEQLFAGLHTIFTKASLGTFERELVAVGNGATWYEEESGICTLDGEPKDILFRISASAGYEQTWERCFVSLVDITDRKRAEEALRRSREETIRVQQSMLAQLSTPVIPISDRIIVMPLIGKLDMARMQQATAALLDEVQRRRASIAILDVTGVPDIDTEATNGIVLAAQAVRLLGAQAILTGIRPEVAQRLVALDADMHGIVTLGTLQAGIAFAIRDPRWA